jgi:hypothetical protein
LIFSSAASTLLGYGEEWQQITARLDALNKRENPDETKNHQGSFNRAVGDPRLSIGELLRVGKTTGVLLYF